MTMYIPLKAVGKQIKLNKWAGFLYTEKKTKQFMDAVSIYAKEYCVKFNLGPGKMGPKGVSVDIVSYRQIPKNWSKKKVKEALKDEIRPLTKPDNDNVEKSIFDSFSKIFYGDDAMVTQNSSIKLYALKPSIEIDVKYL